MNNLIIKNLHLIIYIYFFQFPTNLFSAAHIKTNKLQSENLKEYQKNNEYYKNQKKESIQKRQIIDAFQKNQLNSKELLDSSAFVTDAALLKTLLEEQNYNFKKTFDILNSDLSKYTKEQQQLVYNAKVLLVRAHPELVEGLQQLMIIPARFISYFKEQLPRLNTQQAKQRFTQVIMMNLLKEHSAIIEYETIIKSLSGPYHLITPNEMPINANITKLKNIFNQQTEKLAHVTSTKLFINWWQNMAIEIALLIPRTIGAAIGGTMGAITGTVIGASEGFNLGERVYEDISNIGENTPLGIGLIATIPAGAAVGIPTSLVATPAGAVGGAIAGGTIGAAYGTHYGERIANATGNAIYSTGKTAYDFVIGNNQTSANL